MSNNNYETMLSLCRKVEIVLKINSQSRQNLFKQISLRKSIFIVQTCFYFPHHRHHIEVTNSLLCRNTQYYYGCTRCVVNELAQRPKFRSGDTVTVTGIRPRDHSRHVENGGVEGDSVVSLQTPLFVLNVTRTLNE